MTLPDALEQLAKLADYLDRELEFCGHGVDWTATVMGVEAMRSTSEALQVVCAQMSATEHSAEQVSAAPKD